MSSIQYMGHHTGYYTIIIWVIRCEQSGYDNRGGGELITLFIVQVDIMSLTRQCVILTMDQVHVLTLQSSPSAQRHCIPRIDMDIDMDNIIYVGFMGIF